MNWILKALACTLLLSSTAYSYTANKVWFEKTPHGGYRVVVGYTIPAIKEYREAIVEFKKKREAESFYWDVVQGADFYLKDKTTTKFRNPPPKPTPW